MANVTSKPDRVIEEFVIQGSGETFQLLDTVAGQTVAALKINAWETQFFGRNFWMLSVGDQLLSARPPHLVKEVLNLILSQAYGKQGSLIELQLKTQGIALVPILEEIGFRLVDTRIRFFSLQNKSKMQQYPPHVGTMVLATKEMLPKILELTHDCFTDNPDFTSRFKNSAYFTHDEARRYYAAWITNHLTSDDTIFAALMDGSHLGGYYIYKRAGERKDGLLCYKAVLVAVAPDFRGHKALLAMQSFLYDQIPEDEFYLDNTTQLTNIATMKNHMRSGKSLDHIAMVFYCSVRS